MVGHPKERLIIYLEWIKELTGRIKKYTKGYTYEDFSKDQKTVDAIITVLIQLGETAIQIEHHYPKSSLAHTKSLKSMRNFLVHAYHKIDTSIVWDTIIHDIPNLSKEIQKH